MYKEIEARKLALSCSDIFPRKVKRDLNCGSMDLITSSDSPGPAMKIRTSGANREMIGKASTKTDKPFLGSSKRPMNPSVLPCHFSCEIPSLYLSA